MLHRVSAIKRGAALLLCWCLLLACATPTAFAARSIGECVPLPVSYGKPYTVRLTNCKSVTGKTDTGGMLTDHCFAAARENNPCKGAWVGYTSAKGAFCIEIVMDLGAVVPELRHIAVRFLQNSASGVTYPTSVLYAVSNDKTHYTPIGEGIPDCDVTEDPYTGLFRLRSNGAWEARYVRARIYGEGTQQICLDEFIVETSASSVLQVPYVAQDGMRYTDAQGVTYQLRDREVYVLSYQARGSTPAENGILPSDASFDREGDYILGRGSENEVNVHAAFVGYDNRNFSDLANNVRQIVIHNTATVEPSTTAALYQRKLLAGTSDSSWHYTVDNGDTIYHAIPDMYVAWHAGSDENYSSIGIEMCVNGAPRTSSGKFLFSGAAYEKWVQNTFSKTIENTAVLVAELLIRYELPESAVVQHSDCSGKDCPLWLRYRSSDGRNVHDGDLWLLLKERIHAYYTRMRAQKQNAASASDLVIPEYLLFDGAIAYPVVGIDAGALGGSDYLPRSVTLSDRVTEVTKDSFIGAGGLKRVYLSETHPTLQWKDGALYDTNGKLLFTPTEKTLPLYAPAPESGLWVERTSGGEYWLLGLQKTVPLESLLQRCGLPSATLYGNAVGTGALLVPDGGMPLRIVLPGDANGDGKLNASDYLLAKRTVLRTYVPTPIMVRALCLTGGQTVKASDYLYLKRDILGNLQLPVQFPPN